MHSQQPPGVVQNWSTLQCSKQNTEQCGYDHAPVTRGRMRAQFPLPPGPLVVPHPLSFRGGGGSLGQPKIFRCGSLCSCMGDCVVEHCHLYPLHSRQDILLTFAEMELDSTTMFPRGQM